MQTQNERHRTAQADDDSMLVRRSTNTSTRAFSGSLKGRPRQKQHLRQTTSNDLEQLPTAERYVSKQRTEKELHEIEYGWKQIDTLKSIPPNDYTITHVNQDHDLLVL